MAGTKTLYFQEAELCFLSAVCDNNSETRYVRFINQNDEEEVLK